MQAARPLCVGAAARRNGGALRSDANRTARRRQPAVPRCVAQRPPRKAALPQLPAPSRTLLVLPAPPLSSAVATAPFAAERAAPHAPPPPPLAPPAPPPAVVLLPGLPPVSPRVRGLLLLNLLTLLFGSNVAVVKAAQASLEPWSFGAGRFALAALAFAPALPRALLSPSLRAASAELGLLAAAGYAAQGWGLTATSASHCAFISAFTVILVPILAASGALGRRGTVPPRTWAAAAIAVAGVAVLELTAGGSNEAASSLGGDAASLLAAALFAAQLVRTEHHAARLGADDDADAAQPGEPSAAMALVAGQLATLAACFAAGAVASAALAPPDISDWSVDGALEAARALPWAAWLFTGLISTAGTLWLEIEALRDVSAPDAALVYATEPVWGAAVAAAALGERWAGPTWAGAALIVAGSLYGQLPAAQQEAKGEDAAAEAPPR